MIDAIFVPRGSEERAVRRALGRARSTVRVIATGVGERAAARAVDDTQDVPLRGALLTGFCGLLSPAFAVADTLVYATIRNGYESPIAFDREFAAHVAARVPGVQTGVRAVSAPTVITRAAEKRALGERFGADAVDMESFALTAALRRRDVPVAALRIGSDGVEDDLPELDRALDGSGGIDGFALALAMLRRPIAGARLARSGTRALAALEAAVYAVMR